MKIRLLLIAMVLTSIVNFGQSPTDILQSVLDSISLVDIRICRTSDELAVEDEFTASYPLIVIDDNDSIKLAIITTKWTYAEVLEHHIANKITVFTMVMELDGGSEMVMLFENGDKIVRYASNESVNSESGQANFPFYWESWEELGQERQTVDDYLQIYEKTPRIMRASPLKALRITNSNGESITMREIPLVFNAYFQNLIELTEDNENFRNAPRCPGTVDKY